MNFVCLLECSFWYTNGNRIGGGLTISDKFGCCLSGLPTAVESYKTHWVPSDQTGYRENPPPTSARIISKTLRSHCKAWLPAGNPKSILHKSRITQVKLHEIIDQSRFAGLVSTISIYIISPIILQICSVSIEIDHICTFHTHISIRMYLHICKYDIYIYTYIYIYILCIYRYS